jgi:WD40-like Beta Propeller Repeat
MKLRLRPRLPFATALLGATLSLAALAASAAPASAAQTPFYAIQREHLPVPKGVMPWDPSWSPDGKHILFEDDNHGGEWLANANGSDVHCLTCKWSDNPAIIGGFSYIFPGNKRMLLANELGNLVYVLECSPDLFNCRTHRWLPVDLSGDNDTSEPDLGRRTYHLAPDGIHLAYTITRPDGLVMMIAKLVREPTEYELTDYHVVNPTGPSGPLDTDPDGWANGGSLDELKSFAYGGRDVIILAEPNGIPEEELVNLATGKVTQLTGYDDWTEDGAISPDGSLLLSESWRTEHRLTALGLMPLNQPFIELGDPIMSIYYVSSPQGFACDLQPWLLPATGDDDGALVGQPLNPYGGGLSIPANDLEGQQVWSPDSTRVLLQGRYLEPAPAGSNSYLVQKGPAPSELIVAHILRPPTKPIKPVVTQVGSWAPTPQQYQSSFDMPGTHLVYGHKSGSATITIDGNVAGGSFSVDYDNYSNDGKYFLNGTETIDGSVETTTTTTDNLTATNASGQRIGYLDANLSFSQIEPTPPPTEPGVSMSGTVSSGWMGETASGLPTVGACPRTMPRESPLKLAPSVRIAGHVASVTARVSADVYGETQPVQGATVTIDGRAAQTNRHGLARLRIPVKAGRRIRTRILARAGNTFIPAALKIRLPHDTG